MSGGVFLKKMKKRKNPFELKIFFLPLRCWDITCTSSATPGRRPLRFIYKTWFTFHFQASSRVKVNIQGPTRIIYSWWGRFRAAASARRESTPTDTLAQRANWGIKHILTRRKTKKEKKKEISTCVLSTHVLGSPLNFSTRSVSVERSRERS
jgi:hypothetical protein